MNKGLVIVISAPSGGGKGTILKKLFEKNPNLRYSISATTRTPRPGEIHGEQYYFIDEKAFQTLIRENKMLEYAEYCDHFYGTPREAVEKQTEAGFDVILEI
ncbi:MAG: guanylate kinase, partial [Oscillospiraceae bacterium]